MHLKDIIAKANDDALAQPEAGMVWQVWEDGEITLQKCGSLLWQRNLHCISPGNPDKAVPADWFPHITSFQAGAVNHGYAFVTEDNARLIQRMIAAGRHDDAVISVATGGL